MATWRFELEPERTGTRLRQVAQIGPGRSGLSLVIERMPEREEKIVANRLAELRTNMEATLHGIKALAEQLGQARVSSGPLVRRRARCLGVRALHRGDDSGRPSTCRRGRAGRGPGEHVA
ncbi:hypothetical protein ABT173_11185 [Streptomyces sp. NPDC001795]|uniref:hypothetical protein n=1 Tax=unclassified Streptomyces TaxID=2593676 RepID=UPI003322216D